MGEAVGYGRGVTANGGTAVLTPKVVSEITGRFFVPSYQRGYRWGPEEVRRLLDDIEASGDRPYYLQPIVVKKLGEDYWELVDGQQRLTTLYLILRYIRQLFPVAQVNYSLQYETRSGSADYLDRLAAEERQDNIDYFHIFEAHRTIADWVEGKPDKLLAAMNLYRALSEAGRVTVIWYESPPDVDGPGLFTRLNVGRIPLTDAELVKALVLARTRTRIPGREREVAAQWDAIEHDLRAPEAWAFISGKGEPDASHIGLLLDALAGTVPARDTPLYQTLETLRPEIEADPEGFWNRVVDLHSHIMGWYADREVYHHIGYLVSRGTTLQQILAIHEGATKTQFKEALVERIVDDLKLTPAELRELSYTSAKTGAVLLLMNVATMLRSTRSTERYSFQAHSQEHWSIEHIHAQQAETLNREEQWREWLRLHLEVLAVLPGVDPETLDGIRRDVPAPRAPQDDGGARGGLSRRLFSELQGRVREVFFSAGQEAVDDVDAIDNLALLAGRDNSALSNSLFQVKRQEILALDRAGAYLPVCTRNVFLKYYTESGAEQIYFWGPADRKGYATAMTEALGRYLLPEESND